MRMSDGLTGGLAARARPGVSGQRRGRGSNAFAGQKDQDALLAQQHFVQEADESNPDDGRHVHATRPQV